MERAAFDLHDLTLHGSTDGTHVQLTVANSFRLEGGVEQMLEQRVPGHPTWADIRSTSDYRYYTEIEREAGVENPTSERTFPARSSRNHAPLPRRGQEKQQNREPTPPLEPPPLRRRRRAGHRASRKVQERRARAALATDVVRPEVLSECGVTSPFLLFGLVKETCKGINPFVY